MARSTPNLESWIVKLRLKAGVTQKQLADELDVSVQTIRNWEQGKAEATFTLKQIKAFCSLLNVGLDDLPDRTKVI
ncbi:MAG: helix-turn-helix transcriptional regulator [Cyanobacteria bacterium J06623_5]